MVVASAAFRREKQQHQDWFVKQPQGTTKESLSSSAFQQDYQSHHGPLGDVDAASTATLTSADNILVRSQQNNLPQRIVPQPPPPDDSVYYGSSRLPPPPPPPPPPPLSSVIATSAMLSNISPLTNTIPRVESCADGSHASIPLPAQAHWQSLRRFVVLPRSPEDDVDTTTHSSYWTSTPTMPMVPPPAPPKPASYSNRSTSNGFNNASCDDDVGVAGLTSFLDSITSLCVGEEGSSQAHRRRQQATRNQPNIPTPQFAPPPPYGFEDDTNSIQDDGHFHLEEEDSLCQLPISTMMMKRQPSRQQPKSSPPTWSYRKGVVYPIASYPARLNSKTLVEQRRQDLRQDSFFRPISDDEVSVQPQRKVLSKSDHQRSF